ncbi:MAG: CDP-diacylglycerol--serine O-phosphatidyltransferase [Alphaproteobacteria bacterium]
MPLFQPFDPDDFPGRKRLQQLQQLQQVPVRLVLPNLLTLLSLCAGLTSIRMAIETKFEFAIAFIVVAAALDGIDGRIARFLKSTSRFGAELDSIADFLNFGVAPVVLLYIWTLSELRSIGWVAVLIFGICAALRLARFNAAIGASDKPRWHRRFFVGVPAPAGALVVLLPLYAELSGIPHGFLTAPVVWINTLLIGLLMVSRLPTWSGKLVGRGIRRDMVLPMFVSGVVIAASLASLPWETMLVLALAYLASLPFSVVSYQRLERADAEACREGATDDDAP